MASKLYNTSLGLLATGTLVWATSTVKALIVDSTYTFDETDLFVSEVTGGEVTNAIGTGYDRKILTGKTATLDQANDRITFDASDLLYEDVETNETWAAVVLYLDSGNDATSSLIAYVDVDDLVTGGSDATVSWSADGIFRITAT